MLSCSCSFKYGPNPKFPFGRLKLKGELGSPVKLMVMKEIITVLIVSRRLLPTQAECVSETTELYLFINNVQHA